jgi:hypothetical protein
MVKKLLIAGLFLCASAAPLVAEIVLKKQGPVQSTIISAKDLQGTYYMNIAITGGSDVGADLAGVTHLQKVEFEFGARFLTVKSAEDAYADNHNYTLDSVLARFPIKGEGPDYEVFWGDEATPFIMTEWIRENNQWEQIVYQTQGIHDIYLFEAEKNSKSQSPDTLSHLTFVRKLVLTDGQGSQKTVHQRYNFMKQTPTSFTPKLLDQEMDRRFGYFTTGADKLLDDEAGYLKKQTYITRLDIGKEFVFEIHPNVPEVFHKPIQDAVESWNKVFEKRTQKRPLKIIMGEADHLPADIRYHTIYFTNRGYSYGGYSAYGPPAAIAETGEIIDADVVVDGTALMGNYKNRIEEAKQAEANSQRTDKISQTPQSKISKVTFTLNNEPMPMVQATTEDTPISATSASAQNGKSVEETMYTLVKALIVHEIGHNLGLRHNFAASNDFKNFEGDQQATSIMDYIDAELMPDTGPYDEAAIAYGYDGDLREEELNKFVYLTDEDADTNPLANRHDEGEPFSFYANPLLSVMQKFFVAGEKPQFSPDDMLWFVRDKLGYISKFVNSSNDPRSEKAYELIKGIAQHQFPNEAKYRAKPHLSAAKTQAIANLLFINEVSTGELTRKQRREVHSIAASLILDRKTMMEEDRMQVLKWLAGTKHITSLKALQTVKSGLESRVFNEEEELNENQLEVEENLLLHVESAIQNFLAK